MTDEERIERLENKLKEALSWWRATEKQLLQKCKETKTNQKTIERLKAENAELKSSLTHANEELKTRIRRVEKAVYVAARDEIEATYNVETMDKREYAEQIEAYMFDLFCRADKELAEERKDD